MNNKTKNGLIVVGVVLVGVLLSYKFIVPNNKKVVINYLSATFGNKKMQEDFINKADKGYVDSWAKAIMEGRTTFEYNNKQYETNGGRAI